MGQLDGQHPTPSPPTIYVYDYVNFHIMETVFFFSCRWGGGGSSPSLIITYWFIMFDPLPFFYPPKRCYRVTDIIFRGAQYCTRHFDWLNVASILQVHTETKGTLIYFKTSLNDEDQALQLYRYMLIALHHLMCKFCPMMINNPTFYNGICQLWDFH